MGELRTRVAICVAVLAAVGMPAAVASPASPAVDGELGAGFDSNVANVRQGGNARDDFFLQAGAVAETGWRLGPGMAMRWQLLLDAQAYARYGGLTHASPGVRWRWLSRPGAGFHAPVLGFEASAVAHEYDSRLRDAAEYRVGLWARQQLTTRIALRLGWSATDRQARREAVFDGGVRSGTLDLDWQPLRDWAVYAGYQYLDGDLVSTAPNPPPGVLYAARAVAADDVFDGETAFRLSSSADVGTLGVNYSLSPRLSIDVQARHVEAQADIGSHYRRTLALASLLWRL